MSCLGHSHPAVIAAIRREIGFDGLLMTDDLSMNALPGTVAERATGALAAGCDVILHCNGDLGEMREIAATFEASELPGGFHRAAADIYERLSVYKDCNPAPELPELMQTILGIRA